MLNIPPINKGIPVLEKATNFLSGQFLRWLQSVESRLNKAVVQDANGNIAYGGATIPDDVSTTIAHKFIGSDFTEFVVSGIYVKGYNVYVNKSGSLVRLNDSNIVMVEQMRPSTSKFERFYAPSGVGVISFTKIFEQDGPSGNMDIKTGSTYTATL